MINVCQAGTTWKLTRQGKKNEVKLAGRERERRKEVTISLKQQQKKRDKENGNRFGVNTPRIEVLYYAVRCLFYFEAARLFCPPPSPTHTLIGTHTTVRERGKNASVLTLSEDTVR